jgi:phosphate transport system substrate-binding protein
MSGADAVGGSYYRSHDVRGIGFMAVSYRKYAVSLLLAVVATFIFFQPSLQAGEVLMIGGSGSAVGPFKILGEAFGKSHPGIKINILRSLGSSGALTALAKKAIDIAVVARALKSEEMSAGLSVMPYWRTPFVFIANSDVCVSNITTDEIIRIYRGETRVWPDGKRIRIRLRTAWDAETIALRSISPEMSKAVDQALADHEATITLTSQDNADHVERTPGALGYGTLAQMVSEKRRVKVISYNGLAPGSKGLANKNYPFSVPLIVVTEKNPSAPVRKFIHFLLSPRGKRIMEETGHLVTVR